MWEKTRKQIRRHCRARLNLKKEEAVEKLAFVWGPQNDNWGMETKKNPKFEGQSHTRRQLSFINCSCFISICFIRKCSLSISLLLKCVRLCFSYYLVPLRKLDHSQFISEFPLSLAELKMKFSIPAFMLVGYVKFLRFFFNYPLKVSFLLC